MKDGFDATIDIRSLINIPEITGHITGTIYSHFRPNIVAGKGKEDIVIQTLFLSNEQIQSGILNVNIHAENLKGTGTTDIRRLFQLSKLVSPYLHDQYKYSFWTEIERPAEIIRDADGSYFVNIRVRYRSIQLN